MSIRRSCTDSDNRHVDAHDWIDRDLATCIFKDERLASRFRALLEQLAASPGESIPLACQDWANTKAAYRFLNNDRVSEEEILAGHFRSTHERAAAASGPILVLHDTTEFSYTRAAGSKATEGRGSPGRRRSFP